MSWMVSGSGRSFKKEKRPQTGHTGKGAVDDVQDRGQTPPVTFRTQASRRLVHSPAVGSLNILQHSHPGGKPAGAHFMLQRPALP